MSTVCYYLMYIYLYVLWVMILVLILIISCSLSSTWNNCILLSSSIFEGGGDRACYNACTIWLFFFFSFHLQVDHYIPKHYLPPIISLCGKLEMLDRVLPKLKATDHRVWNPICLRWITASNFHHIGIDICCYICDERYFVNLLWMLNVYDSLCSLCEVYGTKLVLMFWSIFWKFNS
jgi:hypothetical protein